MTRVIAADAVSAAASTVIGMTGDNIEHAITGEGKENSFEDIFYETTNNVIGSVASSVARESKFFKKIKPKSSLGSGAINGLLDGIIDGLFRRPFARFTSRARA